MKLLEKVISSTKFYFKPKSDISPIVNDIAIEATEIIIDKDKVDILIEGKKYSVIKKISSNASLVTDENNTFIFLKWKLYEISKLSEDKKIIFFKKEWKSNYWNLNISRIFEINELEEKIVSTFLEKGYVIIDYNIDWTLFIEKGKKVWLLTRCPLLDINEPITSIYTESNNNDSKREKYICLKKYTNWNLIISFKGSPFYYYSNIWKYSSILHSESTHIYTRCVNKILSIDLQTWKIKEFIFKREEVQKNYFIEIDWKINLFWDNWKQIINFDK